MIWSRSYYSIALLSSVQHPSTRFVKIPPKSHVLVGNRNICDRVVSVRWTPNITSIMSLPIYLWWFGHVRIILSRFSALCTVQHPSTRFVKIPPKSHVLVGNRNICDRVVSVRSYYSIALLSWTPNITSIMSVRWTPNITSIMSLPIYLWWFGHVRIILSRFSAPCNIRQPDLSKSPPNPMFWLVTETYVIGLYRYVEHPISHQ